MRSRSPLQSFTSLHSALRQVPTISWRFNLYQIYSSTLCDQWLDIRVQCHVEAHEGGHPRWHGQRHGDVLLLWTGGLLSQAGIQVRQFLFSRLKKNCFVGQLCLSTLSGKVICVWILENSLEGHLDSIMIGGVSLQVVDVIHLPDLLD